MAEELTQACDSRKTGLEVYTAARAGIEPHSDKERRFLDQLREGLNIEAKLAAKLTLRQLG
jgi:uncharacterized membrane protein YebE (DUF533 family)